jgi:hypothetical protein
MSPLVSFHTDQLFSLLRVRLCLSSVVQVKLAEHRLEVRNRYYLYAGIVWRSYRVKPYQMVNIWIWKYVEIPGEDPKTILTLSWSSYSPYQFRHNFPTLPLEMPVEPFHQCFGIGLGIGSAMSPENFHYSGNSVQYIGEQHSQSYPVMPCSARFSSPAYR